MALRCAMAVACAEFVEYPGGDRLTEEAIDAFLRDYGGLCQQGEGRPTTDPGHEGPGSPRRSEAAGLI